MRANRTVIMTTDKLNEQHLLCTPDLSAANLGPQRVYKERAAWPRKSNENFFHLHCWCDLAY